MCRTIVIVCLISAAASCRVANAESPPSAKVLEKAIYQEQAVGDLQAALKLYRKIVDGHKKGESIAQQAQLRIGLIELKLGNHEQATSILQELAEQYPAARMPPTTTKPILTPRLFEVMKRIQSDYVDKIDDEGLLTEAAMQGVLQILDPYSAYIDARTLKELQIGISGRMVGIGAVIDVKDGKVIVQRPLPGSPSKNSGLVAGDIIVEIDGLPVADLPEQKRLLETVKRCRGPRGSEVVLKIQTAGSDQLRSTTIIREQVELVTVTGANSADGEAWDYHLDEAPEIGYVRIHSISRQTPLRFTQAIESLADSNLKGLIIDLRGNAGGLLQSSIKMADMFVDGGDLLIARNRKDETVYSADPSETLKGVPIAILVDHRTASAAEILAGALQDRGRAVVIGERTFGKGTIQGLFQLSGGGAIRLTTARFFLPSGASLEKPRDPSDSDVWGVSPDESFAIEISDDQRGAVEMHINHFTEDKSSVKSSDGDYRDETLARAVEFFTEK